VTVRRPLVLSPREFEVLRILLAERTTEEIAAELHQTVANLRSLIKDKLGVASDIELVLLALRQGFLTQVDMGAACLGAWCRLPFLGGT